MLIRGYGIYIIIGIAGILFLIILFFFNPESSSLYPPCPFYYTTGYFCPGCGTLRGIHYFIHGHILKALSYNPLSIFLLPFIALYGLFHFIYLLRGKTLKVAFLESSRFIYVLLSIIILYWILRNIPYYPFTLLAPHGN